MTSITPFKVEMEKGPPTEILKKADAKKQILKKDKISDARKYLHEFSDASTLHGVRFVGESRLHFLERLFWLITIVLCAAYSAHEMLKIWHRWKTSPVITSFANDPTFAGAIPFPAVFICSENRIKKSAIDLDTVNFTRIEALLAGKLDYESDEEKFQTEIVGILCHDKGIGWTKFSSAIINVTDRHLKFIIEKVAPKIEEIFQLCKFKMLDVNCKDVFRPLLMYNKVCYSFNMLDDDELYSPEINKKYFDFLNLKTRNMTWNPVTYSYPRKTSDDEKDFPYRNGGSSGVETGLELVMKYPKAELQDLCAEKNPDSFSVVLQSVETKPLNFIKKVFVTPGMKTLLTLQPEMITTAPELRHSRYTPESRGCIFPEERKLRLYKHYTQDNCMEDCRKNFVRKYCSCNEMDTPTTKNDTLPSCGTSQSVCSADYHTEYLKIESDLERKLENGKIAIWCDCFPSCTSVKYKFTTASETFKHWDKENVSSTKYSSLDVHFDSLFFYSRHRSELYGVTDFIASCGGLLGLFTGFSIISGIEILYFVTLRLFCKMKRQENLESDNDE